IADVRVVPFRIAAVVPIVSGVRRFRHVVVSLRHIIRIRINGRTIEEPSAVCPPPPAAAAVPSAMPPASMSPLKPFARRKPVDVPAETCAERIDAHGCPGGQGVPPDSRWYTMKAINVKAYADVRAAGRPNMNPAVDVRRIGPYRCGKRR